MVNSNYTLMAKLPNGANVYTPRLTGPDKQFADHILNLLQHNPQVVSNSDNIYLATNSTLPDINSFSGLAKDQIPSFCGLNFDDTKQLTWGGGNDVIYNMDRCGNPSDHNILSTFIHEDSHSYHFNNLNSLQDDLSQAMKLDLSNLMDIYGPDGALALLKEEYSLYGSLQNGRELATVYEDGSLAIGDSKEVFAETRTESLGGTGGYFTEQGKASGLFPNVARIASENTELTKDLINQNAPLGVLYPKSNIFTAYQTSLPDGTAVLSQEGNERITFISPEGEQTVTTETNPLIIDAFNQGHEVVYGNPYQNNADLSSPEDNKQIDVVQYCETPAITNNLAGNLNLDYSLAGNNNNTLDLNLSSGASDSQNFDYTFKPSDFGSSNTLSLTTDFKTDSASNLNLDLDYTFKPSEFSLAAASETSQSGFNNK